MSTKIYNGYRLPKVKTVAQLHAREDFRPKFKPLLTVDDLFSKAPGPHNDQSERGGVDPMTEGRPGGKAS